ncbi:MAG: GIY-YIG nuclease family protein [Bacteroidetes bacterium]|nr:GIY-YIG nuclease family protein [Bacteroidota bacterium]
MKNISCRSSNLIYCITCKKCHIQYIGQTAKRIKDRFLGHFGDIQRDTKDKPVPLHFHSPGHDGTKDMNISVLEFIKKNSILYTSSKH